MVEEDECRVTWWWRWVAVGSRGRGGWMWDHDCRNGKEEGEVMEEAESHRLTTRCRE